MMLFIRHRLVRISILGYNELGRVRHDVNVGWVELGVALTAEG